MSSKLAKKLSTKPGKLIVPIVDDFYLNEGANAQYMPVSSIKIALNLFKEQNDRISGRGTRTSFSGSSSSNCMREQVINIYQPTEKQEIDPYLVNIFDDGVFRSIRWTTVFDRIGILKEYEETFYSKEYNLSVTPDCILDLSEYYDNDQYDYSYVPVEIKGMHDGEYNNWINKKWVSRWQISRMYQIQTYMLAFNLPFWIIWAENKNDQKYDEQIIEANPVIISYLKDRYKYKMRALKQKVLPATECTLHSSDLKFTRCRRSEECVKLINEEFPSLPPLKDREKKETKVMEQMQ